MSGIAASGDRPVIIQCLTPAGLCMSSSTASPADSEADKPRRVQSRLLRVFVLQLALISAATALGVLAAGYVAERVLVKRALFGEAAYFWKNRETDRGYPLPDTLNLNSYLSSDAETPLPAGMATLPLGMQRLAIDGDERIVHVSERDGERLYLLFQDETVSRLAFWFGLVPLTLVLLVMYGLAWLAYALSKRAVSPITDLAGAIETFDFGSRDASELDLAKLRKAPDAETRVLVDAIGQFIARGQASLERERNFTRYASHELRTPLAVIAGSIATLELAPLEGASARAVMRIRRTTAHMSELIGTLLLLTRERVDPSDACMTDVGELVDTLVAELASLGDERSVSLHVEHADVLRVRASEATLSLVIGNLLRNAWMYTEEGQVDVIVQSDAVTVSDTGPGLDEEACLRVFEPFYRGDTGGSFNRQVSRSLDTERPSGQATPAREQRSEGAGLGLAIARQICGNHGWILSVDSTLDVGSIFRVCFGAPDQRRLSAGGPPLTSSEARSPALDSSSSDPSSPDAPSPGKPSLDSR